MTALETINAEIARLGELLEMFNHDEFMVTTYVNQIRGLEFAAKSIEAKPTA